MGLCSFIIGWRGVRYVCVLCDTTLCVVWCCVLCLFFSSVHTLGSTSLWLFSYSSGCVCVCEASRPCSSLSWVLARRCTVNHAVCSCSITVTRVAACGTWRLLLILDILMRALGNVSTGAGRVDRSRFIISPVPPCGEPAIWAQLVSLSLLVSSVSSTGFMPTGLRLQAPSAQQPPCIGLASAKQTRHALLYT